MIPDLDRFGLLPAGVHRATLSETIARFGRDSELRRAQGQSLEWTVDAARRASIRRFIVNGSWATSEPEPNDVDCVLLIDDEYDDDAPAARELQQGFPFVEIQLVDRMGFDLLVESFFATDRIGRPKGVVEIAL